MYVGLAQIITETTINTNNFNIFHKRRLLAFINCFFFFERNKTMHIREMEFILFYLKIFALEQTKLKFFKYFLSKRKILNLKTYIMNVSIAIYWKAIYTNGVIFVSVMNFGINLQ